MELLIFVLVAAAAAVLALGPLLGASTSRFEADDEIAPPPSDRQAIREDVATGKLEASEATGEEGTS